MRRAAQEFSPREASGDSRASGCCPAHGRFGSIFSSLRVARVAKGLNPSMDGEKDLRRGGDRDTQQADDGSARRECLRSRQSSSSPSPSSSSITIIPVKASWILPRRGHACAALHSPPRKNPCAPQISTNTFPKYFILARICIAYL